MEVDENVKSPSHPLELIALQKAGDVLVEFSQHPWDPEGREECKHSDTSHMHHLPIGLE